MGVFDAIHVRGEVEFHRQMNKHNLLTSQTIYTEISKILPKGGTVFVATDIKDGTSFFDFLRQHYNLIFLHDCQTMVEEMKIHPQLWGLVEQLVASRGRFYFASTFSTFGSYIARLQGYHLAQENAPNIVETGSIATWPMDNLEDFHYMTNYNTLKKSLWAREFPTCWRDLHRGIVE
jgi:GDP-fucose protein O-fucosyltransferase